MSSNTHDSSPAKPLDIFSQGGETGQILRNYAWENSSLGPVENWPQPLKTAVRIMMTSQQPFWVSWGKEMIYMYNDAFKSIIGGRHPRALGMHLLDVWAELYDDINPMLSKVMDHGEGVYVEEQQLIMERNGYPEETYYTFSYSPIPNDDGSIGGIICANTDDTQRVISDRQLTTLQKLATVTAEVRTIQEACEKSLEGISINHHDILFALLYLPVPSGDQLQLVCLSNIKDDHPILKLHQTLSTTEWPFFKVASTRELHLVEVTDFFNSDPLPTGGWDQPSNKVAMVPINTKMDTPLVGVLVIGLNPFRLFDSNYQGFVQLIARQIEGIILNARAFEQERQRAEALAKIDRAKTLFFSNVSHEFRTPLTLMLGPLEQILQKEDADKTTYTELRMIQRNGIRLLKLVNTLLDFSRVEAGRIRASFTPIELDRFTGHLASHFRSALQQAKLTFNVDCPSLSEPIYVDIDMWEKIVFNLLSNAFKFTYEGSITIQLVEATDYVELIVKDCGIGIPKQELRNVFKRFHRVENSGGRTHEGSGIGLALVKELVKLHGGNVSVKSKINVGTTFTVQIPKGCSHLPQEQIAKPKSQKMSATHAAGFVEEALWWLPQPEDQILLPASEYIATETNPRELPSLLIADDNADMREYIRGIFQPNYKVLTVSDGEQALQSARQFRPDLLISDVMMPNMDGITLLATLRKDKDLRDLPVVLLSARAGEEAEIEGLQAGANDYLVKPFSARELSARVESILTMRKLRYEQENHFRIIADNSPAILWTTSTDGSCTYFSQLWYELTGGSPPDDLGFAWMKKIHKDDFGRVREFFSSATNTHKPFRIHYRLRHLDGNYRWVIDSGVPRFDSNGYFYGFVGCVFDVHDQITAEEHLKSHQQKLKEADQRKDEFLATLAHELRNPLAPIGNAVHILQMTGDGNKHSEALSIIDRQLHHLVRLVDDLMDVSRITRGKVELRKSPLNLKHVIENTVESVIPLIQANQQELIINVTDEHTLINGDLTRISQVFTNILNNASKYTQEGGRIELTVKTENIDVCVDIRDNGIGIPAEQLDRIFEMFLQLDSSIERVQGGLGIGLTLVKQLVILHGGTITVSSEGRNKGSCFSVRLPRIQTMHKETEVKHEAISSNNHVLRILVVDDNEESALTLTQLLRLAGYDCLYEFRGAKALSTAKEYQPHVLLLDIGMPDMNGFEVCRKIKQDPKLKEIICIAQTGWGEPKYVEQSQQAGFEFHMVKPLDFKQLNKMLSNIANDILVEL